LKEQQWGYWHVPGEDTNNIAKIQVDSLCAFAGH
jgi:hypothetical protein